MCNNAQWITLYIILNSIVTFLFVLKTHNHFRKKGERKKECTAGIWTRDLWLTRKLKNALPGFEVGTSGLQGQCTNHYTTETSPRSLFKKCLECITILYCTHGATGTGMRSGYAESRVVARVCTCRNHMQHEQRLQRRQQLTALRYSR